MFDLADGGEIFVELFAVARGDALLEAAGFSLHGVHDALAVLEAAGLLGDFFGGAVDEQFFENFRRPVIGGHRDAAARDGQAGAAVGGAEDEAAEARGGREFLEHELVEGNGVAKTARARMRRGGEKARLAGMSAVHVGMRHAGEDGEIAAQVAQRLEVGRQREVAAGLGGEKVLGVNAQRGADGDEAADGAGGGGRGKRAGSGSE